MGVWQGKNAVVTGASSGIGWELAKQLAAGGANLVLTARRSDRLEQLAREISERYEIRAEVCIADLARAEGPEKIFRFTQERGLIVDVLINNAGFGIAGEFHTTELPRLLEMAQVNVTSVVHLTRLMVPAMVERRSGYVMILASTASFQPVPYLSGYAATKAFDLLFAEGIAEELRPHGVRVCALCPGSTATEFQQVAGQTRRLHDSKESAEKVARVGLEALAAGKPLVISGFKNWLGMELQRFAPRHMVTRVAANMFRPRT